MISKESNILEDAEGLAEKFGFRSLGQWSSDLLSDVASERKLGAKIVGCWADTHQIIGYEVDFEIGKARLSDVRWRPPAAQHGRRDHGRTIVWRRLVSASVIIINEAKRCVGSVLLALSYIVARRAFNFKAVDVEEDLR